MAGAKRAYLKSHCPKTYYAKQAKEKERQEKTNSALSVWRGRILKNGVITASPNATTT